MNISVSLLQRIPLQKVSVFRFPGGLNTEKEPKTTEILHTYSCSEVRYNIASRDYFFSRIASSITSCTFVCTGRCLKL